MATSPITYAPSSSSPQYTRQSRKRARSASTSSSSPDFLPSLAQAHRPYPPGRFNQTDEDDDEDEDHPGRMDEAPSAKKRPRRSVNVGPPEMKTTINPESERARQVLEGMYIDDHGHRIAPAPSVSGSLFGPGVVNFELGPSSQTVTEPDGFQHDGDLEIFDSDIQILQPESVQHPDSPDVPHHPIPPSRSKYTSAAGVMQDEGDGMDMDAEMMIDPESRNAAIPSEYFGRDACTQSYRASIQPSGPTVEEIPDEDQHERTGDLEVGSSSFGLDDQRIYDGFVRQKGKGKERAVYRDHEPEKDRIIITSLSDTETSPPSSPRMYSTSSSSSPSPTTMYPPPGFFSDPIDLSDASALGQDGIIDVPSSSSSSPTQMESRSLAQPGENGFTISPSLLSRMNEWQSAHPDQYLAEIMRRRAKERDRRGLVVYRRPVGWENSAGGRLQFGARESVVGRGDGMESDPEEEGMDDGRVDLGMGATIEEYLDEQDVRVPSTAAEDDVSMIEVEAMPGLTEDVDSMDIE